MALLTKKFCLQSLCKFPKISWYHPIGLQIKLGEHCFAWFSRSKLRGAKKTCLPQSMWLLHVKLQWMNWLNNIELEPTLNQHQIALRHGTARFNDLLLNPLPETTECRSSGIIEVGVQTTLVFRGKKRNFYPYSKKLQTSAEPFERNRSPHPPEVTDLTSQPQGNAA